MRRHPDQPGPNVDETVKSILGLRGRKIVLPMGKLGSEMGRLLAELAVEVQDKIDEAKHWRTMCEAVRGETKTLVAILLRRDPKLDGKIVISRAEFEAIPEDAEVVVDKPETGVRIYRLTTKAEAERGVAPLVLQ